MSQLRRKGSHRLNNYTIITCNQQVQLSVCLTWLFMHSLGFNQVSERKKNFLYIHVIYFIPTGSDGSGHLEYLIHKKYVSKKLKLCSDYPMIIHVKI